MRRIDLHCYPGTQEWITAQGPFVEALGKYWNRAWTAKTEHEVVKDFADAGVEAVLVAYLQTKEIAKYKLPERLEVMDDFPLSKFGKVAKNVMVDMVSGKIQKK